MYKENKSVFALIFAGFMVFGTALIGCGGSEPSETVSGAATEAAADAKAAVEDVAADSDQLQAILAAADMTDGTADKVVSKCATCSFGMDGSADHSLAVEGYEMHFCSADCKDKFAANPVSSVLALDVL